MYKIHPHVRLNNVFVPILFCLTWITFPFLQIFRHIFQCCLLYSRCACFRSKFQISMNRYVDTEYRSQWVHRTLTLLYLNLNAMPDLRSIIIKGIRKHRSTGPKQKQAEALNQFKLSHIQWSPGPKFYTIVYAMQITMTFVLSSISRVRKCLMYLQIS